MRGTRVSVAAIEDTKESVVTWCLPRARWPLGRDRERFKKRPRNPGNMAPKAIRPILNS